MFNGSVRDCKIGDVVEYHYGFLANDRDQVQIVRDENGSPVEKDGKLLKEKTPEAAALNNQASALMELSECGVIVLFQKKGEHMYTKPSEEAVKMGEDDGKPIPGMYNFHYFFKKIA